jgi:hypothetical protein
MHPIVHYHWGVDGGSKCDWHSIWQNDQLGMLAANRIHSFNIPNIPSGVDKLFYIIEHNTEWNGTTHQTIQVVNSNIKIERLRTTWDHPLARHINSKPYNKFIATLIPEILTRDKIIKVAINLSSNDRQIHIREMGTIDLY